MAQDADDQFEDDNQGFEDEAPKSRKKRASTSTGTNWGKIVLIMLGVGVVSLALCCGGAFYFFKDAMVMDPVKVATMQKEIIEINLPPGMTPVMGMNMNFGVFKMKMVMYNPGAGTSLMLMEMQIAGQTEEQMKQGFNQQAGQNQNNQFRMESSETKKITVDGKEREFLFAKGTMTPPGGQATPVRMITGMFPSKNGMGFIQYSIDEEAYDEAAVIQTIESIHK